MSANENPDIFIGRHKELDLFSKSIESSSQDVWIMSLIGEGGQGKTKLLNKFSEVVEKRSQKGESILVTTRPIDFYLTTHQHIIGLLDSIASQFITTVFFNVFFEKLTQYKDLSVKNLDPAQLQLLIFELRTCFVEGYNELSKSNRIVLLFDTIELVGESLDIFWDIILPEIRQNTFVVVAGRKQIKALAKYNHQQVVSNMYGFNSQEISDYLRHQGIDIDNVMLSKLENLSDGRPILIALFSDWYKYGHSLSELLSYEKSAFEKSMVSYIEQIRRPEDQAILAMAHFYRRFNSEMLAYVTDSPLASSEEVIKSVSRFTFVKYRPGAPFNSCLLHDEMRDMINKHVWSGVDPLGELRLEWTKKILDYYKQKIEMENDRLNRQDLRLELLHYWLDIDLEKSFMFSRMLFDEALDNLDLGLMEAVNAEVYSDSRKYKEAMNLENKFRLALVEYVKENYNNAILLLESVVGKSSGILLAKSLAYLIELCAKSGKADESIKHGALCESICLDLLKETSDGDSRQKINRILALAYGNLGFFWQVTLGDIDKASEYYDKAISLPNADLPPSFIAHIRNNLAYTCYFQRKIDRAESLNQIAEKVNLRLGIPYELGFTYYIKGMLFAATNRNVEAMDVFERSTELFDKAKNEHGKALVYVAYGRLLRQLGWYKETLHTTSVIDGVKRSGIKPEGVSSISLIQNNDKYSKSYMILCEAQKIFLRYSDWSNCADALNELGCLFRQIDDWDISVNYFNQAVVASQNGHNRPHEMDCLLDAAITYYRKGDLEKAHEQATIVKEITFNENFDYLFSKSQHLLSDIAFEKGDFDVAFQAAADSCIYVLKRPTKERAFDEALDSIVNLVFKLPSSDLVKDKTEYLIKRWIDARLEEKYPKFIDRMNTLLDDYNLWASDTNKKK